MKTCNCIILNTVLLIKLLNKIIQELDKVVCWHYLLQVFTWSFGICFKSHLRGVCTQKVHASILFQMDPVYHQLQSQEIEPLMFSSFKLLQLREEIVPTFSEDLIMHIWIIVINFFEEHKEQTHARKCKRYWKVKKKTRQWWHMSLTPALTR